MGIIIALIVFSVIIIFHEFGHFLLAKKNGIGVTEFALGMGPTIFGVKRGETTYCLKALPIGGLCAMVGEDTDEVGENSFNSKVYGRGCRLWLQGRFLILLWHLYLH